MIKNNKKNELLWGYVAQILNIFSGIIVLPAILYFLTEKEVGLWIVFITIASIAQLFEFGIMPTLCRNVAYIYSGSQTLIQEGIGNNIQINNINKDLLSELLVESKKTYRIISLSVGFFMYFFGSIYLWTLVTQEKSITYIYITWIIFSTGYVLTYYYSYINGFLQGKGDITYSNKSIVWNKSAFIIISVFLLVTGSGLKGLGLASLAAAIVGRFVAIYYFRKDKILANLKERNITLKSNIRKIILYNSIRLGVVQLGAFLIQKANILLASSFLGLEIAGQYGITLSILLALSSLASVPFQIKVPYICRLQANKKIRKIKFIFCRALVQSSLIYIIGLLGILFFGEKTLNLVSKNNLLSINQIAALGIIIYLEMMHSIAGGYLITLNTIPFVKSSILSGVGIVILSTVTIDHFGIMGLIISQGVVQILYNNWKWPMEAFKTLDLQVIDIFKIGFTGLLKTKLV